MIRLLLLPVDFFVFWFVEAPFVIVYYFASLNTAFLHLASLPLLIQTYFRPWKNEYRKGLVGVAIGIGIVVKSCAIAIDSILLALLIACELAAVIAWISLPLVTILLLII